ncbi:MAG: hypothetical protein ACQESY_04490 [Pseudomonadota bacterium]
MPTIAAMNQSGATKPEYLLPLPFIGKIFLLQFKKIKKFFPGVVIKPEIWRIEAEIYTIQALTVKN